MVKPRDEFDQDFGLSGLTQKFRPSAEIRSEADALDLVEGMTDRFESVAYAHQLLEDVQRLVGSALPDEVIHTLWLAATRAYFDPAAHGLDSRTWLRRIADVCVARIRRGDPSFTPAAAGPDPDQALTQAVLEEIRGCAPALTEAAVTSAYADPLPDVVSALERALPEVGADLGFRLFLRAMQAYFVPISETRHARFLLLGERLGYHEFVVDDGCLNVWDDLVD
ncbi:hypothetical protein [Streptomyces sp. GC420]|uniref:hypothetical protein n=1 Tax=Streptomyces sp. GC420 TaxID=2697568 RepID=UPI0014151AF1|nr:hypothetical protein [Streptomyces sp. GC420]NBM19113.1 hypothetical protein [Streptomyces sp. GC420]